MTQRKDLVTDFPETVSYVHDLATTQLALGVFHQTQDEPAAAEKLYIDAQRLCEDLLKRHAGEWHY